MADPTKLKVQVKDVAGRPIPGAQVEIVVQKGTTILDKFAPAPAPREVDLKAGFVQIMINASAPLFFPDAGELLYNVFNRWGSTNGSWKLTEDGTAVMLDVFLGRVRFAPVVALPDSLEVAPNYIAPGIVLDERPQYRMFWPEVEKKMMILRRPAVGSLDKTEWDRFAHEEVSVKLGEASGNWLFLEYGDPEKEGMNVRFLLGVWAPHAIPYKTPAVVVQLTPNPQGGIEGISYPVDRFPFTGAYPYRMIPEQLPKPPATTVPISRMHQRYADLAIDRCLLSWFAVYQIYGARPDLFSGPNGPIMITIVPATTSNQGIQRAPMSHREGIGRVIAEVLRFLWSRLLTLTNGTGRIRLLFPSSGPGMVTASSVGRPTAVPEGFPPQVTSTILTHSAGAGALAEIVSPFGKFPKDFSQDLWGRCLSYGEDNWKGIWLMDGVARDDEGNVMYQPEKGSAIVELWKKWARGSPPVDNRRFVAVYCEAGLGASMENGLVEGVRRVSGKYGWIEEGQSPDKKITWLRMSNSLLAPSVPTGFPGVTPLFGGRRKPHDDVFMIGIGYAARPSP